MTDKELVFEYELPLQALSAIFVGMGWEYDIPGFGLMSPTPDMLEGFIESMVEGVAQAPNDHTYMTLARLLVFRDAEFPDDFDIYVKVGHCSPAIPAGVR